MKFFPSDWKHDTRCLTPLTRGIWIDLLCTVWPTGTKTLPQQNWLRELSVTEDELAFALHELQAFKVANITISNGDVTVISRRMQRDNNTRELTRKRVNKLRGNANVTRSVTAMKRVEVRSQKSEVRDQKSETRGQKLEARSQKSDKRKTKKIPSGAVKEIAPAVHGIETWNRYMDAYVLRYGVMPVRNLHVNSQLLQLVKRLGSDDAPLVAGWYVQHNKPLYVANRHPTNLLLRDAEGLRTQWATGVKATTGEARNLELQDDAQAQVQRVEAMLKGGL
jgi:uncharacterized protein YdaU (DUF1376 family)